MDLALRLFDKIQWPSTQLYTIMVNGNVQNHTLNDALLLLEKMPVRDTVSLEFNAKEVFRLW